MPSDILLADITPIVRAHLIARLAQLTAHHRYLTDETLVTPSALRANLRARIRILSLQITDLKALTQTCLTSSDFIKD